MPAYYLHLLEKTARSGGTTVRDIDLANSGGSSKYRLSVNGRVPGTQTFRETWTGNALVPGRKLTNFVAEAVDEEIIIQIRGSSIDDVLAQKSALERFFIDAMRAQVERSNDRPANYFLLAEKPLNTATNTSTTEILSGTVTMPRDWASRKLEKFVVDGVVLRIKHEPYFTASVLDVLTAEAIDNGANNGVEIFADDGGGTDPWIQGTQVCPLRVKVDGGDDTTVRMLIGTRVAQDVTDFTPIYWAKDATLGSGAAALLDQTYFNGNGLADGVRYTAPDTDEHMVLRWTVTNDVQSQYGVHRLFGRMAASAADLYSVRARFGLTDGTNIVYPFGYGYTIDDDDMPTVAARTANALHFVDLDVLQIPIPATSEAIYGFVIELHATCSNITGSPTLDIDGIWLFPTGEGGGNSGFVDVTYELATADTGIDAAFVSAIGTEPRAYLANASGTVTFHTLTGTQGIWAYPQTAMKMFFALLDADNLHDHTLNMEVTVSYELREAGNVGVES